ncbi:unnamed protein product [Rhizoctonia solani]|uniref:F-box domain-containing protein n=1 Tax=Rhizoctonia solani TaxID=456999 RepID=A0A8H3CUP8_9AGAM|nr:unnamed protein product [Rhizoctonia solani]CAE7230885.1 unnamed protein product [Rhizoctonia solani]
MHKSVLCPSPSFIQEWENAGASLASAISRFLDLSTQLESQCIKTETTPSDLIALIDSSLSSFQTRLNGQLTQARLALVKTRNRLTRASSILRLPEEVLTDIFLHFVYSSHEDNRFSDVRMMDSAVELIYRRLHVLLGVCASWRNIAISCGSLWFLIPIVDPTVGRPRALATELSVQRAGNRPLHLAVFKPHYSYTRLQTLAPRFSQVESINIWSDSESGIELHEIIRMLLTKGPKSLSKLSLKHLALSSLPPDSPFNHFTRPVPQLLARIKSLSTLRISNITVAWERVSFSRKLTEFWIGDVVLDEFSTLGFFAALVSAPELQHLTIVSTRVMRDDDSLIQAVPNTFALPKLKTMHLENLPYSFLDLLYTVIARGPYRLTLIPGETFFYNYPLEETVAEEDIYDLFERRPVHTLVVAREDQGFWEVESTLRTLLRLVPALKVLTLNFYEFDRSLLKCLARARGCSAFPKLEVLEIHASVFPMSLEELKEELSHILEHHPIKRMVIGGRIPSPTNPKDEKLLDEDNDTIRWLKTKVPQVYVSADVDNPPTFAEKWQLWDI